MEYLHPRRVLSVDTFTEVGTNNKMFVPLYVDYDEEPYRGSFYQGRSHGFINDVYHIKPNPFGDPLNVTVADTVIASVSGTEREGRFNFLGLTTNNSVKLWFTYRNFTAFIDGGIGYNTKTILGIKHYQLNTVTCTIRGYRGGFNGPNRGMRYQVSGTLAVGSTKSIWRSDVSYMSTEGRVYLFKKDEIGACSFGDAEWTKDLSEVRQQAQSVCDDVLSIYGNLFTAAAADCTSGTGNLVFVTIRGLLPIPTPEESRSLFKEDELVRGTDPALLGSGLSNNSYWRNWLVQHAYVSALEQAPVLSDNHISNIGELISFVKGIIVDHRVEIPHSLSDAWLSYRYVYGTSKMDVEDAVAFVKRHMDVDPIFRSLKCYGSSTNVVEGVRVTCRCSLLLRCNPLEKFEKVWHDLYTYGLQPNLYVLWDMVPYSFLVDWFIPVGDMLHSLDVEQHYLRGAYDISEVCFSISYDEALNGSRYHHYYRWGSRPIKSLNNLYWLDKPKASKRVQCYRIVDTAALFIGK